MNNNKMPGNDAFSTERFTMENWSKVESIGYYRLHYKWRTKLNNQGSNQTPAIARAYAAAVFALRQQIIALIQKPQSDLLIYSKNRETIIFEKARKVCEELDVEFNHPQGGAKPS